MRLPRTFWIMTATLVALSACAKKPDTMPPEPLGTRTPTETVPAATAGPARPVPGSQADFIASVAADRIFFDTDKFDVDGEDQQILRSQAEWLSRYPAKRVTVEGHADERGTRDYNLALGERRANAAKNFLASLGIDPARISTISYGKERPDALGSDEASWARNRRAVTITVE